jgi:hypothetical protein
MYDTSAAMTNDEDFEYLFVIEDEDGVARDLTDIDLEVAILDPDCRAVMTLEPGDPEITKATNGAGEDYFSILIPYTEFTDLTPGTYTVAGRATFTDTGRVKQLFFGELQIQEGGF